MDLGAFIERHWQHIASTPGTFILFGLIVAAAAFGFARLIVGGELAALRERLSAAKEDLARAREQRDEVLKRLEAHGEDIGKLRADLDAMPRFHVHDRPPGPSDLAREGDVWMQYDPSSGDDRQRGA